MFFLDRIVDKNNLTQIYRINIFIFIQKPLSDYEILFSDNEFCNTPSAYMIRHILPAFYAMMGTVFPNFQIKSYIVSQQDMIYIGDKLGFSQSILLQNTKLYQDYYPKLSNINTLKITDIWNIHHVKNDVPLCSNDIIYMDYIGDNMTQKYEFLNLIYHLQKKYASNIISHCPHRLYVIDKILHKFCIPAHYGYNLEYALSFFKQYKNILLSVPFDNKNQSYTAFSLTGISVNSKKYQTTIENFITQYKELQKTAMDKTISVMKNNFIKPHKIIKTSITAGKIIPVGYEYSYVKNHDNDYQPSSEKMIFLSEALIKFIHKCHKNLAKQNVFLSNIYIHQTVTKQGNLKYKLYKYDNHSAVDYKKLTDDISHYSPDIYNHIDNMNPVVQNLINTHIIDTVFYAAIYHSVKK